MTEPYKQLAHAARANDTEAELVTRAREYLAEKVLDLADVPKMIALLVKVWDEYTALLNTAEDTDDTFGFDLSTTL